MAKNLLIALDVEPRHIDLFKAIGNLNITVKKQKDVTALDIKGKNIIVGNVNPNLLSDAEDLEFLQLNSAGYDNYVGKLPKKTILCTSVGAFSPAVGEHILAMTFSLIRHFHLYRDKQNRKDWSDCGKITSVEGSTIAVFGLGDIGRSYAKKVKADKGLALKLEIRVVATPFSTRVSNFAILVLANTVNISVAKSALERKSLAN